MNHTNYEDVGYWKLISFCKIWK